MNILRLNNNTIFHDSNMNLEAPFSETHFLNLAIIGLIVAQGVQMLILQSTGILIIRDSLDLKSKNNE